MSKICGKCGKMLDEQSVFCTACGTPYQAPAAPVQEPAEQPAQQPAPQRTRKPAKKSINILQDKKLLSMAAAALVATVALIVILCVALSGSPEEALDNYYAMMEGDADAIADCIPECVVDTAATYMLQNADLYATAIRASAAENFGEDLEVTYEIVKEKEMPEAMVQNIGKMLGEKYNFDPELVEAGYMLHVEIEKSGTKLVEWDEEIVYVVEIDGDWFMIKHYKDPVLIFETIGA